MKTYEQMAEDVFNRSKIYINKQRRNRKIIACAGAVGCMALLIAINTIIAGAGTKGIVPFVEQLPIQIDNHMPQTSKPTEGTKPQEQLPTEGTKPQEQLPIEVPGEDAFGDCGIVLLAAQTMTAMGVPLEDNLELPLNYSLRVRDFRGMSSEERIRAELEEKALYQLKMNDGLGGASMKLGNCTNRENYMISFIRTGCFRLLWTKDHTSVKSIRIYSTTNYGKIEVSLSNNTYLHGPEVILMPEDIPEQDWENGLRINWKYSNAVLDALDENPTRPFSDFSDVVVFAVEFSDGTVQECKVEILLHDDGEVTTRLVSAPKVA